MWLTRTHSLKFYIVLSILMFFSGAAFNEGLGASGVDTHEISAENSSAEEIAAPCKRSLSPKRILREETPVDTEGTFEAKAVSRRLEWTPLQGESPVMYTPDGASDSVRAKSKTPVIPLPYTPEQIRAGEKILYHLKRYHIQKHNKDVFEKTDVHLAHHKVIPLDIHVKGFIKRDKDHERLIPLIGEGHIIAIVEAIPNLEAQFFNVEKFMGKVEKLPVSKHGSSTDFLYLISRKTPGEETPLFLIKGISSSNRTEMANLEASNANILLQQMPLDPELPKITRPEVLYSYIVTDESGKAMGVAYLSVLHLARGQSLNDEVKMINNKPISDKEKIDYLKPIFYQLGRSLALFNQHCAQVDRDSSIAELNENLPLAHEDLHYGNIFISAHHKEAGVGKKRKIIFIDNESLGRSNEASWFYPGRGQKARRLSGQFYMLYGWALFGNGFLSILSPEMIHALYYEGLIEGYASAFDRAHRDEAITFIKKILSHIDHLFFACLEKHSLKPRHKMERILIKVLNDKIAAPKNEALCLTWKNKLEAVHKHEEERARQSPMP